jgi:hypothetical protein
MTGKSILEDKEKFLESGQRAETAHQAEEAEEKEKLSHMGDKPTIQPKPEDKPESK